MIGVFGLICLAHGTANLRHEIRAVSFLSSLFVGVGAVLIVAWVEGLTPS